MRLKGSSGIGDAVGYGSVPLLVTEQILKTGVNVYVPEPRISLNVTIKVFDVPVLIWI